MARLTVNPGRAVRRSLAVALSVGLLALGVGARPALALTAESLLAPINAARSAAGLTPLTLIPQLTTIAHERLQTITDRESALHTAADTDALAAAGSRFGLSGVQLSENLSLDLDDPATIVNAWLGSAQHHRNLLAESATGLGLAAEVATLDGQPAQLVVAIFSAPLPQPTPTSNWRLILAVAVTAAVIIIAVIIRNRHREHPQKFNPFR